MRGPAGVLPPRFLTAPFSAPFETCTPGPLLSISVVLQPWALEPLTGIAAGRVGPLPVGVPPGSAAGNASIAQLSHRHGFADQAHLARDTRALVDETPAGLRRLLQGERAPWSLRPALVRFVQDGEDLDA